MANVQHPQLPALEPLLQRGDASRGCSTESARATLLQRGDASRGSSTESARATLLQRRDASRGSSTESARATLLQRGKFWCLKSNNPSQNVSDTWKSCMSARRLLTVGLGAASETRRGPREAARAAGSTLKRRRADVQLFQVSESF